MGTGFFSPPAQHRDLAIVTFVPQTFVALPSVGVYRAARRDAIFDEGVQAYRRGILNRPETDSPDALSICFRGHNYQGFFTLLPTSHSLFQSSQPGLVYFHPTRKFFSPWTNHGTPQLMQPGLSGLIASQSQDSFQSQSAGAVLLARHIPHGAKPNRQRLARALKDCPGSHRGLMVAGRALEQLGSQLPDFRSGSTLWTPKPIRPAARLATLVEKERERLDAIISSIPGAVWETWGPPDNPAKQVKCSGKEAKLSYTGNLLVENRNSLIVTTELFQAKRHRRTRRRVGDAGTDSR
jgi:hypothetical protein